MSFFIFCLYHLLRFFVFLFLFLALFVEWFWVRKFLLLSEGADIICQWGAGDDAPSCVWGIPSFKDIPLGSTKVPGLGC